MLILLISEKWISQGGGGGWTKKIRFFLVNVGFFGVLLNYLDKCRGILPISRHTIEEEKI